MFVTALASCLALAALPGAELASHGAAATESATAVACPSTRPPVRRPPLPPRGRRHLRLGPGGLRAHEDRYGHCCRKHVGRSPEQMLARLRREKLPIVSSFTNMKVAQRVLRETLEQNASRLANWEAVGNPGMLVIYGRFNYRIGTYVRRGSPYLHDSHRALFRLVGNQFWPGGFQIVTGYPVP